MMTTIAIVIKRLFFFNYLSPPNIVIPFENIILESYHPPFQIMKINLLSKYLNDARCYFICQYSEH